MKNDPAFPTEQTIETDDGTGFRYHCGLTKREYFAGQAIQGTANSTVLGRDAAIIAVRGVKIADALIAELEKTNA